MGFNYGLEKKNFDSQWAVTRKQYENAGMRNEAIQAMYDYDWSVFNANRSYQNHTQEIAAPSFEQSEESYSPLMNKYQEAISVTDHYCETNSRFAWVGKLRTNNCCLLLKAYRNLTSKFLRSTSTSATRNPRLQESWVARRLQFISELRKLLNF